jgi:glycosyltransferase involved in cell wall biosynthesis
MMSHGARPSSVLMVINTTGLQYDDRLRKEAGSLQALGLDVSILGLEYANRPARLTVYEGVVATTIRLRSRGWFAQSHGVVAKTVEMYLQIMANVLRVRPHVVWCHDLGMAGLVPVLALFRSCGVIRSVVWDQHELPSDGLLQSRGYRRVYEWLLGLCDSVVMANHERRALIVNWFGKEPRVPIEVLENYPDARFGDLVASELPPDVTEWLDGSPYLLAQGGANPDRHLDRLVAATLRMPQFKLVVVGPYLQDVLADLEREHGSALGRRVLFTGPVPQLELTRFIDRAYASVVLYQADSANTRLCAPNRLYQALVRGVPVVVGVNPPMADLVNARQCGVVLRTDGADIDDLCEGFRRLESGYEAFKANAAKTHGLLWESQQAVVARIVEPVLLGAHENSLSPASCE